MAQNPNEINALLGRGSEFEGKLTFEGTVRIDGKFTGEIFTDDMLIIGEGASVSASIEAGTCIVFGDVSGDILTTSLLELRSPARLKGNVQTANIVIERGVTFDGSCRMDQAEAELIIEEPAPVQKPRKAPGKENPAIN